VRGRRRRRRRRELRYIDTTSDERPGQQHASIRLHRDRGGHPTGNTTQAVHNDLDRSSACAVYMSMPYLVTNGNKASSAPGWNTEYNAAPNPSAQRFWGLPGLGVPAAATEAGRMLALEFSGCRSIDTRCGSDA
jgi:hypothetical protein